MISSHHFAELIAYDRLRVPDGVKSEYYLCLIAWLLCEINRDKKARPAPFKLDDFFLPDRTKRRKRKKKQTSDEMFEFLKALTLSMGGTVPDGDSSEAKRAIDGG
jgi:hypothetical protein